MRTVYLLLAAACVASGACLPLPAAGEVPADGSAAPSATSPPQACSPAAPADSLPDTTGCVLPAGTPIPLEILDTLSSTDRKRGDRFALRVSAPVAAGGCLVIPAGTPGIGEIVHAAPSHGGGQAGELLLAARYLELDGRQIALRGMKLGQATTGRDTSGVAIGLSPAIGPFALFIHGGEIEIPAHTSAVAKLARDSVPVPCLAAAGAMPEVPAAGSPGATAIHLPSMQDKE